jgi:hypothetical protein
LPKGGEPFSAETLRVPGTLEIRKWVGRAPNRGLWACLDEMRSSDEKKRHSLAGTISYCTNGRIYDSASTNPHWYHFPSLAVNCAGDMIIAFSGSGLTNYIGAFCTWRLANGSALLVPRVIQAGLTHYVNDVKSRRWGDYSATSSDPADVWAFWTVQQYADPSGADSNGDYAWRTVIRKLRPSP